MHVNVCGYYTKLPASDSRHVSAVIKKLWLDAQD